MNKEQLFSLIRHALTVLGGAAVAGGFIDASGLDQLVGAAMILVGVGWSQLEKKVGVEKSEPPVSTPPDSPAVPLPVSLPPPT